MQQSRGKEFWLGPLKKIKKDSFFPMGRHCQFCWHFTLQGRKINCLNFCHPDSLVLIVRRDQSLRPTASKKNLPSFLYLPVAMITSMSSHSQLDFCCSARMEIQSLGWAVAAMPLIPALRRQRQVNLCESWGQPGLPRQEGYIKKKPVWGVRGWRERKIRSARPSWVK